MDYNSPLTYDPAQRFEVQINDIEYRHDQNQSLKALVYQPLGNGPFPALLDVHGGAWNRGSRTNNEVMNLALASSGIVVAAVDYRLAPEYPYPSQVADVNYATRWLKARAPDFNADPNSVGGLGSSSGGHTMMLSALRPHDPRYASIALPGRHKVDARVLYVLCAWPVLDPYGRYLYAQEAGAERLIAATEAYFLNQEAMREGNPQLILDSGEKVELPPTLIVQGTADDNVPMSIPESFVRAFRGAGGEIELAIFPGMPHGFGNTPGPESERAIELMKAFITRQLTKTAATI